MNSTDTVERLVDLTKSWDVAGALLGHKEMDVFHVVLNCVGEEPHQRRKSSIELSAEISSLMGNDYVPIGFIAWREHAPKRTKLLLQLLPEASQDPWAKGVFDRALGEMMEDLRARGVIVDIEQ